MPRKKKTKSPPVKPNFQSVKQMKKSAHEKMWAYKIQKLKNCIRETQNVPRKKITKMTKNVFHGYFSFWREKKNWKYVLKSPTEISILEKCYEISREISWNLGLYFTKFQLKFQSKFQLKFRFPRMGLVVVGVVTLFLNPSKESILKKAYFH